MHTSLVFQTTGHRFICGMNLLSIFGKKARRELLNDAIRLSAVSFAMILPTVVLLPSASVATETVLINIQGLGDQDRSKVISALAQLRTTEDWQKLVVKRGDTLYRIINSYYGYYLSKNYLKTVGVLTSLIRDTNQISDINHIKIHQKLKIPVLPMRPKASRTSHVQDLDVRPSGGTLLPIRNEVAMLHPLSPAAAHSEMARRAEADISFAVAVEAHAAARRSVDSITAAIKLETNATNQLVAELHNTNQALVASKDTWQSKISAGFASFFGFSVPKSDLELRAETKQRQYTEADTPAKLNRDRLGAASSEERGTEQRVADAQNDLPLPVSQGSVWVIRQTPEQAKLLRSTLSIETRNTPAYYDGPSVDEWYSLSVPDISTENTEASENHRHPSSFDLRGVNEQILGKYYLLDFFKKAKKGASCPHGDQVIQVATQVLEEMGIQKPSNFLVPKELDFYDNVDRSSEEIKEYLKNYDNELKSRLMINLPYLRAQRRTDPFEVPGLYLRALYRNIISKKDASVVSSCFKSRFDGSKILPLDFTADSQTILLSAVLDQEESTPEGSGLPWEPISTFLVYGQKYPVVLVGAEKIPGQILGMSGEGVTILGSGTGWGKSDGCLRPREIGTSLATPSVAAILFLARGYWSSLGEQVQAREAIDRLVLGTETLPAYVRKCAAAGIPAISRLFRQGSFAVLSDGNVVKAEVKEGSYIEGSVDGSKQIEHFRIQKSRFSCSAFFCGDGRLFVFTPSNKWEWISNLSSLDLRLQIDGVPFSATSLSGVEAKLRALVLR